MTLCQTLLLSCPFWGSYLFPFEYSLEPCVPAPWPRPGHSTTWLCRNPKPGTRTDKGPIRSAPARCRAHLIYGQEWLHVEWQKGQGGCGCDQGEDCLGDGPPIRDISTEGWTHSLTKALEMVKGKSLNIYTNSHYAFPWPMFMELSGMGTPHCWRKDYQKQTGDPRLSGSTMATDQIDHHPLPETSKGWHNNGQGKLESW